MKQLLPALLSLLLLSSASARAQERMTLDEFKKIADTPGDTTPLSSRFNGLPLWTNSNLSISLKYADGRTVNEDTVQTAKTIGGKFVVTTTQTQRQGPRYSIFTYDEKASAYRIYALYQDAVIEGTMVIDLKKKIAAVSSIFGDLAEISVGSFSDTERSERSQIYKCGVLYLTREVRATQRK